MLIFLDNKFIGWILFIYFIIFSNNLFSEEIDLQIAMAELENKVNEKLVLGLTVNGQLINSGAILIKGVNGSLLISKNDLTKSRINLNNIKFIQVDNEEYTDISNFKNVKFDLDTNNQGIQIFFDESYFIKNKLTNKNEPQFDLIRSNSGIFLNYDIYSEFYSARNSLSGLFEIGGGVKQGLLTSNLAYLEREENREIIRLDSTYRMDTPEKMTTLRLGDAITQPSTTLGRPVRFGGIQYGTNFQLRPGYLTIPSTTINGQAGLPSTVELFVNNVLQSKREVPPGPFAISGIPLLSGNGQVQMVVTDLTGRQTVINQPFYSSPSLLAQGLTNYSIEIGKLRNNFGLESNDYGKEFIASSYRLGVFNNLTVEASTQLQHKDFIGLQGAATTTFTDIGLISIGAAYSRAPIGHGSQKVMLFERWMGKVGMGYRQEWSDETYRQLGIDEKYNAKSLQSINFSYYIDHIGSLSISGVKQTYTDSLTNNIVSLTFSTSKKNWGNFVLSFFSSVSDNGINSAKNNSASISWILPLEHGHSTSLMHIKNLNINNSDQTILQYSRNISNNTGVGYRLQTGVNVPNQVSLEGRSDKGIVRLEAAEIQGQSSARLGMSGSIVKFNENYFISQRVNDSYAVVNTNGIKNVRVYLENQAYTKTNDRGIAFIPRLRSFSRNHVSIEQADLPFDVEIASLIMQPVPAWRTGIHINFPIKKIKPVTLKLIKEDCELVTAGSSLKLNGVELESLVGYDGLVYLTNLQETNQLEAYFNTGQCKTEITVNKADENIPYLGEFICKSFKY
jgi:outer membrane usher protein